jgi:hypothetical protein
MSRELIVGPDATNATEQLDDLVGDDILFDRLSDLATRDASANVWDDTDVQARLAELGIQLPAEAPADPAATAEPAVDPAAQQPVQESRTKELAMDLEDPLMSDEEFETKYGDSRANMQSRAGRVQDRRSGEWYDPAEKFDQLKNSPEFQSQMRRMARREGMAEGDAPIDFDWYRKQQQRQTQAKQKPGVAEGEANAGETLRSQIIKLYKRGLEDYDIAYDLDIDEKIVADIIDDYDRKQQQRRAKQQGMSEASKEKTPGIALSKAYQKDFDGIKPVNRRPETALTGTYSKTGKPGGELKKRSVEESYPKHQDLSGISTEKLKAYLAKQSQQQVSGEGNQVKRVRAELQRRSQGVAEGSDHSLKKVWDRYSKHLMAARGDHPDMKQINKSGDIVQNIRKYVKDHHGQKAVDDMERYAEKKQWDKGVAEASKEKTPGVAEGGCNATMEGEMCPEHGLAECGMHESQVAESQEGTALLARIKSLALLR